MLNQPFLRVFLCANLSKQYLLIAIQRFKLIALSRLSGLSEQPYQI